MEKLSPNSNTDKHPDGSLSLLDGKRTLVSGNNPLATEIATSHEIIIMENVKNLELEHELTHSSMIPELYNKKGFLQVVDKALSGYKGSAAMIYFDANKFKQINDTHGHAVGDAVIKEIGKAILSVSRKMTAEAAQDSSQDILSHQSGDEFCALLMPRGESVYNKDQANLAAERYLKRLKEVLGVIQIDSQPFALSLASGVVIFDKTKDYSVDIQKIIKEADKRMLASKSERQ
jgi:diguanylate cyclase (GGDEF)-like protein